MDKSVVDKATLAPSLSVAQFVIGQILEGIKLKIVVDKKEYEGVVYNLDFSPGGSEHVFAEVKIPNVKMSNKEDDLYIKASINRNGEVHVLSIIE